MAQSRYRIGAGARQGAWPGAWSGARWHWALALLLALPATASPITLPQLLRLPLEELLRLEISPQAPGMRGAPAPMTPARSAGGAS